MRDSRSAQRRQIDAVQLPLQCEGSGGQFPILHDRTQCGSHYRPGRTAGGTRPYRQSEESDSHNDRDSRYCGTRERGVERRGARQQVPCQHPEYGCHHPCAPVLRQRQHHPCGRLGESCKRQGDYRHGADDKRPRNGRQPSGEGSETGADGRRQERQTAVRGISQIQGSARIGQGGPHGRNSTKRNGKRFPTSIY